MSVSCSWVWVWLKNTHSLPPPAEWSPSAVQVLTAHSRVASGHRQLVCSGHAATIPSPPMNSPLISALEEHLSQEHRLMVAGTTQKPGQLETFFLEYGSWEEWQRLQMNEADLSQQGAWKMQLTSAWCRTPGISLLCPSCCLVVLAFPSTPSPKSNLVSLQ